MNPDPGRYLYSNRLDDGETADPTTDTITEIMRPAAPVPNPPGNPGRVGREGRRDADSDDWNDMFIRDGVDINQAPVRREDTRSHMPEECTKECLPPPADHEIEFIVKDALSYPAGMPTRSAAKSVGNFRFKILVFPSGTQSTGGLQV